MQEPERLLASGATDFERKLLEAVKDERPSAELQQRMQQALGLSIGTASPGSSPTSPPPTGAALSGGLKGALLKVALGAIVAGGLASAIVWSTTDGDDRSVSPPTRKRVSPTAVPAPQRDEAPATTGAETSRPQVSSPAEAVGPGAGAEPEPTSPEGIDEPRAPTAADDLRLEIELLDAVRAASSVGESKRAREVLERYDERFPRGALQREAEMLRRGGVDVRGVTPSAPSRGADPEAASGR